MFAYYLNLALRSLKCSPVLTGLMVLAIGLGIGASMTMITVLHVMSGDPLPGHSAQLYYPRIDPQPLGRGANNPHSGDNLTWPDAQNLLLANRAERQAAMSAGSAAVYPVSGDGQPFFVPGHYVTADFFPMFDVPFRAGGGWTREQDQQRARVVVLSADLKRKLFGDAPALGRTVHLQDTDFRVIGVLGAWHPQPKFYADLDHGAFDKDDQFFLPLQTALDLSLAFRGQLSCWGSGGDSRKGPDCTWLQFWVQLATPAKAQAYQQFLDDYWRQQQDHGRFSRPVDAKLYGLMSWLAYKGVVPGDVRMQLWLAVGFLLVCMVNIVALLLAKFLRRSGEISVRRAMGARIRDIFAQFAIESALVGVAGGLLGLVVAQFGLWSVRQRPDAYAKLAHMDMPMLFGTLALAIAASVLAGLLPAWRACRVPPALQLKTL